MKNGKKKKICNLLTFALVTMLCVGFVSCGKDDEQDAGPNNGQNTPSVVDFTGWWMVKTPDIHNYRGESKSSYRTIHIINTQVIDVIDLTTERDWWGETNAFAVEISGTNYYYLNRSTYQYTREDNTIIIPNYPYTNNIFYYEDNQIIRDSDRYYKVK